MDASTTAEILVEAFPYIKDFSEKIIVIKLGGSVMNHSDKLNMILQDIVLMKYIGARPILIHGGGKHISALMERVGKEAVFHKGLRVTDTDTMELTQMVLAGLINKDLVSTISRYGGQAVGISGKDGGLIKAQKIENADIDLGHVGKITKINPRIIQTLENDGFIPVVSPVANSPEGESLNINGDSAAMAVAEALSAEKLVYITDVKGILRNIDDESTLISKIKTKDVDHLINQGIVSKGMIPKIKSACDALEKGVQAIHIISGMISHALLIELYTEQGIGTKISR